MPCTTDSLIDGSVMPTCQASGPNCFCIDNHYMDDSGDCVRKFSFKVEVQWLIRNGKLLLFFVIFFKI